MERQINWNMQRILLLNLISLFITFNKIRFKCIVYGCAQHKITTSTHKTAFIFP